MFGAVIRTSSTFPGRRRRRTCRVSFAVPFEVTATLRRRTLHRLPRHRTVAVAVAGASRTTSRVARAPLAFARQLLTTVAVTLAKLSPPAQSSSRPLPGISDAPGQTAELVSSQSVGGGTPSRSASVAGGADGAGRLIRCAGAHTLSFRHRV